MNTDVPEAAGGTENLDGSTNVNAMHPVVRIVVMMLVAAAGTAASLAVIDAVGPVYEIPKKFMNSGGNLSREDQAAANAAKLATNRSNAVVWIAIIGAILGGLFPLALGLLRRAGLRTILGVIAGIVVGAALGAAAGYSAVTLHHSMLSALEGSTDLPESQVMTLHAVTWGLIGCAIGLACGLATPRVQGIAVLKMIVIAGVLGCLGGAAFPLVAGIKAPLVNSSLPVPEPGEGRVIWIGLSSLLLAIGIGRAG